MKQKIYLIEDQENEFNLVKARLFEYEIIPNNYEDGFIDVQDYLKYPTKVNRKRVVDFILGNSIDIIILDIELVDDKYGGIHLYDQIISQEQALQHVIVIYLTKTTLQSDLTLTKTNAYVEKKINSRGFDVDSTVAIIKNEIHKLLKMRDSNSQWFIDNL